MRSIDFYEFVAVLVPGVVLVAGIGSLGCVGLGSPLSGMDNDAVNALVFLVLAYVTGHLIAAIGNWLEVVMWKPCGGMPTDWPVTKPGDKRAVLWRKAVEDYRGELCDFAELDAWRALLARARSQVYASDRWTRVHAFNGNYGMFRGLMVSELLVAGIAWRSSYDLRMVYAVLGVALVLSLVRLYRFGILYAGELFSNIANLPSKKASP